jgi:hypothetical protein
MSISHLRKKVSDPVIKWYGKYERPISSLSLIGGFVFDALTLKRVDEVWENIWVLGHLVLVAVLMIFVNWVENDPGDEKNPEKVHFWLVNALQFLFGGILSVFLVFYFRSADLSTSWPFILLLALAFWANESLKRRFVRLTFQVALLFLSIFSTAIFLVPVLFHRIGVDIFLYSGFISLGLIFFFLLVLSRVSKEKFRNSKTYIYMSVVGVYLGINFLYFTNLIPPLPISIEDSGVYYSISKGDDNNYHARYKYLGLISHILFYPKVSIQEESDIYAYSAVFSPTYFDTSVIHEWQHYDEVNKVWTTESVIPLKIVGGREGGFRTYSNMINPELGKWRVNVLTSLGHVVGRIRFEIVDYDQKGEMRMKILE